MRRRRHSRSVAERGDGVSVGGRRCRRRRRRGGRRWRKRLLEPLAGARCLVSGARLLLLPELSAAARFSTLDSLPLLLLLLLELELIGCRPTGRQVAARLPIRGDGDGGCCALLARPRSSELTLAAAVESDTFIVQRLIEAALAAQQTRRCLVSARIGNRRTCVVVRDANCREAARIWRL